MKKILTLGFVLFFTGSQAQVPGAAVNCNGHTYYVRATFTDISVPVHDISTTNCPDGSVHNDTEEGEYLDCKMELFLDAACTQPVAVDPRFFSFAPSVPGSVGTVSNPSAIYRYECNAPLPAGSTYADNWRIDRTVIYVNQCIWECAGAGYYNCYPTSSGMPTNYNIVVNCCYAPELLAVRLVSFEVVRNAGVNTLRWGLADTADFSKLAVERSFDGVNFSVIYATADAAVSSYADFTDVTAYYRVKVYNTAGGFFYSPVVVLKAVPAAGRFIVSPSPFFKILNVSVSTGRKLNTVFKLVSPDGKVVFRTERELKSGVNAFVFDIPPVAPGMYIMVMSNDEGTGAKKILKQ